MLKICQLHDITVNTPIKQVEGENRFQRQGGWFVPVSFICESQNNFCFNNIITLVTLKGDWLLYLCLDRSWVELQISLIAAAMGGSSLWVLKGCHLRYIRRTNILT